MVNILVIDDEKDVTDAVGEILSLMDGYRVTTINSAAEAYRRVTNNHYDLIVTDFRMPKTNGIELIRAIRLKGHNQDVPVIIITGYPDEVRLGLGTISKVMLIPKPFSADQLISSVQTLLKSSTAISSTIRSKIPKEMLDGIPIAMRTIVGTLTKVTDLHVEKQFIWDASEHLSYVISSMVTIEGIDIKGYLSLCFPERTYLMLTSEALGKRQLKINKDNQGFSGDLIQMLYSEACRLLSTNAGYDYVSTNPQILLANPLPMLSSDKFLNYVMIFKSSLGSFFVVISVV